MSVADVVLCVGEPLVVLAPTPGHSLSGTPALEVTVGGAEANVAVHLARLGLPTRFAGLVGDDPFGARVLATLAAEGVDIGSLHRIAGQPTGLYAKDPGLGGTRSYYYRTGSAASSLARLPEGALTGVALVHVSGILASLGAECRRVVDALLDGAIPVSFDVNHRPGLWPTAQAAGVLCDLGRRASIVFVGLDEAAALWGCGDPADVRALFPSVELVVKDAGRLATAFLAGQRVDVPALTVEVVEPVGAGDAFAAGYLSCRRSGGDLAQALRTGHAVAAGVLAATDDHGNRADPELLRVARTGEGWPDGRD